MNAIVATILLAATATDYSSWYWLQESDPNRNSSSYTRENWSADGGVTKSAASEGNRYYVPEGMDIYSGASAATFAGDSLAIAGTYYMAAGGGSTMRFNELRLAPGGTFRFSSNGTVVTTGSNGLVVEGTEDDPSSILSFIWSSATATNLRNYLFSGKMTGGSDNVVRFAHTQITDALLAVKKYSPVLLNFDLSEYCGKTVVGEGVWMSLGQTVGSEMGCIFEVSTNAVLTTSRSEGQYTVGGLSLKEGSTLRFYLNTNGGSYTKYTVTNSFSASGRFVVEFGYSNTSVNYVFPVNSTTEGIRLIHLTADAVANSSFDLSRAVVSNVSFSIFGVIPPNVRLGLLDNNDGSKDVAIIWDRFIEMNVNNASGGSGSPLAFVDGSCWSTGEVPDEDFDGYALVTATSLGFAARQQVSRPKMHLVVKSGTTVYMQGNLFEIGELSMEAGSSFLTYNCAPEPTIKGDLVVYPKSGSRLTFCGWGRTYKIASTMSGSGDVVFKNYNAENPPMSFELFGTNTNYSGLMTIASFDGQYDPSGENDKCTTLYLNDGRNIGGAVEGDLWWKGFEVSNWSKVVCRGDVTASERTRGIYVNAGARVEVPEGKTFSIASPVTYEGVLRKTGAGCLELGGAAMFSSGDGPGASPMADSNRLVVAEGSLKISSTNAIDGVQVELASGVPLVLDLSPSADGMAEYGAVSTKWSVPFVLADGSLSVKIDDAAGVLSGKPNGFTVAICTLLAENAGALSLSFAKIRNYRLDQIVRRTNADGSVTILAGFSRCGALIIMR